MSAINAKRTPLAGQYSHIFTIAEYIGTLNSLSNALNMNLCEEIKCFKICRNENIAIGDNDARRSDVFDDYCVIQSLHYGRLLTLKPAVHLMNCANDGK